MKTKKGKKRGPKRKSPKRKNGSKRKTIKKIQVLPSRGNKRKQVVRTGRLQSQVKSKQAMLDHQIGKRNLKRQFGARLSNPVQEKKKKLTSEYVPYFPGHVYTRGNSALTQTGLGVPPHVPVFQRGGGMPLPVFQRGGGGLPMAVYQRGGDGTSLGGFQVFKQEGSGKEIPLSDGDEIVQSGGINYMRPRRYNRYGSRPMVFSNNTLYGDPKRHELVSQEGSGFFSLFSTGAKLLARTGIRAAGKTAAKAAARKIATRASKAIGQAVTKKAVTGMAKQAARKLVASGKNLTKKAATAIAREGTKTAMSVLSGRKKLNKKTLTIMTKKIVRDVGKTGVSKKHLKKSLKKTVTKVRKQVKKKATKSVKKAIKKSVPKSAPMSVAQLQSLGASENMF